MTNSPLNHPALVKNHECGPDLTTYVIMIDDQPLQNYLRSNNRKDINRDNPALDSDDCWQVAGLDHGSSNVNWLGQSPELKSAVAARLTKDGGPADTAESPAATRRHELNGRISVLSDLFKGPITVQVRVAGEEIIWSHFRLGQADGEPINAPALRFLKDEYLAFVKTVQDNCEALKYLAPLKAIDDNVIIMNQLSAGLRSMEAPIRQIVIEELGFDRLPEKLTWGFRDPGMIFLLLFWLACGLGTALISILFINEGTTEAFVVGLIGLTISVLMLIPPTAGLLSFIVRGHTYMVMDSKGLSFQPNRGSIAWEHIAGYKLVRSESKLRPDVFVIRLASGFEPVNLRANRRIGSSPGEVRLTLDLLNIAPKVDRQIYDVLRYHLAAQMERV